MTLPGAERAVVDKRKVREYLLSREHPVGRYKAAAFSRYFGFTLDPSDEFVRQILLLAATAEAVAGEPTEFGQKWVVRGTITGPKGRVGTVTTIWLIPKDDASPRLITAVPGRPK